MGHVIPIIIIIKPKFANSAKSKIEEKKLSHTHTHTHTFIQNITSSSFLSNKIRTKILNLKKKNFSLLWQSFFFTGEISPKRETQLGRVLIARSEGIRKVKEKIKSPDFYI